MKQKLHEICQSRKETINPRVTNQTLAHLSGKSVTSIAQFFRGEIAEPSVYTVGPICKALGISLDEYFEIGSGSDSSNASELAAKLAAAEKLADVYAQELQRKTALIVFLLFIVLAALTALIIDISNPNVGWIRDTMSILREVSAHV